MTTVAVTDPAEADRCFVAYAAHELRGAITVQRTLAEVALADPNANTTALRKMGEQVAAACERQARLLDALLTLARSEYGHLRREPVDLAASAAEALQDIDHRGLTVSSALEPARTSGDARLIDRLIANLIVNAVRHNIPGGHVEIDTYTAAGRAGFTIANTGPVITSGELPRLFQPFQRLEAHGCPTTDGIGLGLAIVQAIADAHDAVLNAEARIEGGLKIDIDFPAST